jgi:hypothetical protein
MLNHHENNRLTNCDYLVLCFSLQRRLGVMATSNDYTVNAGRLEDLVAHRDHETGEVFHRVVPGHAVEVRTRFGHSYTHLHRFDDTADGLARAERLAQAVKTVLDVDGIGGLNLDFWSVRTIYGTDAYLDEEPEIVQREREDEMGSDFFGGRYR